jgi:tRNA pseudouridine55 synthase
MNDKQKSIFEDGQVLLFDKPVYWTSFDLINKVRIIIRSTFGIKKIKVGHAGTLDPLASGLMIVCTGKATKKIDEFRDLDKEYIATIHLGETTPSFDLETETDNQLSHRSYN